MFSRVFPPIFPVFFIPSVSQFVQDVPHFFSSWLPSPFPTSSSVLRRFPNLNPHFSRVFAHVSRVSMFPRFSTIFQGFSRPLQPHPPSTPSPTPWGCPSRALRRRWRPERCSCHWRFVVLLGKIYPETMGFNMKSTQKTWLIKI